uniref:Uncharacterized protein n=1 Tax=Tetranychus urticae TaxID=32264 RepID=T1JSW4_TETUR
MVKPSHEGLGLYRLMNIWLF